MIPHNKVQLVINAARLYYENRFSQMEIAEQLYVSRSYVLKLFMVVKEENIATVKIKDLLQVESRLEQTIRSYFQLCRVIAIPSKVGENSLNSLCDAVAKYLDSTLKSGDFIVTGWSRTVYVLSQRTLPRTDLEGVRVIAAVGTPTNSNQNTYCTVSAVDMAEKLGGTPYSLLALIMIQEKTLRTQFSKEKCIEEMMDYAAEANVAVSILGDTSRSSFWTNRGVMPEERMQELFEEGAIGDVFLHILDIRSETCDETLDEETIAMPFKVLKQEECHIGIAAGRKKIDAVYSALKGGVVNVLVIDEDIAKATQEKIHKEDGIMRWKE